MRGQIEPGRPLSWPDQARFRAYVRFLSLFSFLFAASYFGGGYVGGLRQHAFVPAMAWETAIPLVQWAVFAYLSLIPAFLIPLFHLTEPELRKLSMQSTVTLLVAAFAFVLFPTQAGYAATSAEGHSGWLLALIDAVDVKRNLVPSLHVAFGALIALASAERAGKWLAVSMIAWLVSMAGSTLLTHRHHLLDIAAGLALAVLVRRYIKLDEASSAVARTIPRQSR